MSWFEQLREKHIFRTAFIYLGGAWASMEAIGFFVDNYGWSRTVLDVAVLLIVLGFPAALIIAWYHGESGKQQVQKTEASLLLTLAVLAAIGTFRLSTAAVNPASQMDPVSSDAIPAATVDLGERSVAVLPFVNSTGVDSLDWLGPGMSDMLTTNLAQTGALRVVSRERLFELLRQQGRAETDEIARGFSVLARISDDTLDSLLRLFGSLPEDELTETLETMSRTSPATARRVLRAADRIARLGR